MAYKIRTTIREPFLTPLLLATGLLLTSCASAPPAYTRDEFLAITSRTYPGIPPERLLAAAEQVLRQAGGRNVGVQHRLDGFVATRRWSRFLLIAATQGTDQWLVETRSPSSAGTLLHVSIASTEHIGAMPAPTTAPGVWSTTSSPGSQTPVLHRAVYDLFYERLDYVLGRRETWSTCKSHEAEMAAKHRWAEFAPLCDPMTDDSPPPKAPT